MADSDAEFPPVATTAAVPRVHDRACLVDLRCVPESEDERLRAAVQAALTALTGADGGPGGTR